MFSGNCKKNINSHTNSLITMNRCAAIYGALYFVNPSDINSKEYENRYKIFLQSAVLEDISITTPMHVSKTIDHATR